jgi:hypothetical protein
MAKKIGHLAIERDSNGIFIIADGVKEQPFRAKSS